MPLLQFGWAPGGGRQLRNEFPQYFVGQKGRTIDKHLQETYPGKILSKQQESWRLGLRRSQPAERGKFEKKRNRIFREKEWSCTATT